MPHEYQFDHAWLLFNFSNTFAKKKSEALGKIVDRLRQINLAVQSLIKMSDKGEISEYINQSFIQSLKIFQNYGQRMLLQVESATICVEVVKENLEEAGEEDLNHEQQCSMKIAIESLANNLENMENIENDIVESIQSNNELLDLKQAICFKNIQRIQNTQNEAKNNRYTRTNCLRFVAFVSLVTMGTIGAMGAILLLLIAVNSTISSYFGNTGFTVLKYATGFFSFLGLMICGGFLLNKRISKKSSNFRNYNYEDVENLSVEKSKKGISEKYEISEDHVIKVKECFCALKRVSEGLFEAPKDKRSYNVQNLLVLVDNKTKRTRNEFGEVEIEIQAIHNYNELKGVLKEIIDFNKNNLK